MNNSDSKSISKCRVCGHNKLRSIFNFGKMYLLGSFFTSKDPRNKIKLPLNLVMCENLECNLIQLKHNFNKKLLFSSYFYESSTNIMMKKNLDEIAIDFLSTYKNINSKKNFVLDIGCNDGYLLNKINGFSKIGVDPSNIKIKNNYKNIKRVFNFFPSNNSVINKNKYSGIFSIAMFYDLENPNLFVENIKKILKYNGIWILEVAYTLTTLKRNSFDTVCHEHLEYYSFKNLKNLINKHDLKIFKIKTNDINGGSLRLYITHNNNKIYDNINENIKIKNFQSVENKQLNFFLNRFSTNIISLKKQTLNLIRKLIDKGKLIHFYGASTKGNVIIQYYGLHKLIKVAAEVNKNKFNKFTCGTRVKIINEEDSLKIKPDYYFILPWGFLNEFINKRKKHIKNNKVKFIVPLPKLKIISKSNL